jgi:type I restriction enzyme S subunit
MSKWREYLLSDLIYTNKSTVTKGYKHEKILYLDTGSIVSNKIETLQEFNIKDAPSRAKRLVENEDIVYSSVRPNQLHYGFIKNPPQNLVVSTGFVVIKVKKETLHPKFLYFYLTQSQITEFLHSIAEGSTSTYPSLKPEDIHELDILLPPLPEQERIAEVLSSLDDKIDLLHKQNKTLEEMAETLFRQWFVEEADETNLANEFNVTMGQSPPGDTYNEIGNGIIFYQGRTDFGFRFPKPRVYCTGPTRFAETFETLMSVRAPVGDINYAAERCCIGRGVAAISHKNNEIHHSYTYYLMKHLRSDFDIHEDTGTIFGSINKDELLSIKCPKLYAFNTAHFNSSIGPLDDKIVSNCKQISQLEALRDTLLPKLMSGLVTVNEIA